MSLAHSCAHDRSAGTSRSPIPYAVNSASSTQSAPPAAPGVRPGRRSPGVPPPQLLQLAVAPMADGRPNIDQVAYETEGSQSADLGAHDVFERERRPERSPYGRPPQHLLTQPQFACSTAGRLGDDQLRRHRIDVQLRHLPTALPQPGTQSGRDALHDRRTLGGQVNVPAGPIDQPMGLYGTATGEDESMVTAHVQHIGQQPTVEFGEVHAGPRAPAAARRRPGRPDGDAMPRLSRMGGYEERGSGRPQRSRSPPSSALPPPGPPSQFADSTFLTETGCRKFAGARPERHERSPSLASGGDRPPHRGEVRDLRDALPVDHSRTQIATDRHPRVLARHAESIPPHGQHAERDHGQTGREPQHATIGLHYVRDPGNRWNNSKAAVRQTVEWRR